ncbi:MAG: M48 family metalloprotease [Bradymonadaceae bacterium]|nr:M48 family metalloprotease [Lujinxingiaceae bacterium]
MRKTSLSIGLMVVLLGAAGVLSTGCPGTRPGRVAADVLVPPSEETQLGEQVSAQVERELRMHPNAEVQQYVRGLGEQIVRVADNVPDGINFTFQVVDDKQTSNAFALPGGWIYVYSGLMANMDNEAELIGVIAHEVAHVTRRHVAQRLVTLYGVDLLTRMALGQEPGIVQSVVATIVQQGFLLRYSRGQETDADNIGLTYIVRANYDPQGFISFFQTMVGQPSPPTFLLTHPAPEDRIRNIEEAIAQMKQVPTRTNRERFQAIKSQL